MEWTTFAVNQRRSVVRRAEQKDIEWVKAMGGMDPKRGKGLLMFKFSVSIYRNGFTSLAIFHVLPNRVLYIGRLTITEDILKTILEIFGDSVYGDITRQSEDGRWGQKEPIGQGDGEKY